MSYILEALKKADQERGIGAVPNLATPHEVERPQTRSYRWLWVVVILLMVNAVLVAMLLQDGEKEAPAAAYVPPERRPALINDQPAEPVQQSPEATVTATAAPEKKAPPEKVRTPSAGGLVMLPEPANLQGSRPSPRPEEESDGRIGAATTPTDNSHLPSWYELPQEIRSRLDLPRLDLHVYSDEPQDRFILVNLKKYREGERLESGLLLEEILPNGMVMSYRGERFLVEK